MIGMETAAGSIRLLRCRMGWSQSELALRMGVQTSQVQDWESGQLKPDHLQEEIIANLFRRSEALVIEMIEAPIAEEVLRQTQAETVNYQDLNIKNFN